MRITSLITALFVTWLIGAVIFIGNLPRQVEDPSGVTDAIIVLTGGSDRIEAGVALLATKRAEKLFISGVYRGVEVSELLRMSRQLPDRVECCIVLGHGADNTVGNATETAEWMGKEKYSSLRLVTASYHMPRSLVEFQRLMPNIRIIPHPVFPERVKLEDWWRHPGTTTLLIGEYHKYLAAKLRYLFVSTQRKMS
jgi:uncharacterized SAM-binding protein YcdF (DUF218 family)